MAKYDYTVRLVSFPANGVHRCVGRIVSVMQTTYNPAKDAWYSTVLVERPANEEADEEDG